MEEKEPVNEENLTSENQMPNEQKEQPIKDLPTEEKPQKSNAQKKEPFLGIPTYLLVLFSIAIIMGAIALSVFLEPKAPPVIIDGNDSNKTMEIELLYSNECSFCEKHNTIFDTFTENSIPFTIKETEISSTQGIKQMQAFQPNILPAAIVPQQGLKKFPEIKQAMDQSFTKVNGYYVVPESNLDSTKLYSRIYVEPVYPADCNSSNDQNSTIIIFDDPYNELMIKSQPLLKEVLAKVEGNAKIKFEYIQANTSTLNPDTNQSIKDLAGIYLFCAGEYSEFNQAFERMISTYCGAGGSEITPTQIAVCPLSPHFGKPLTQSEIENSVKEIIEKDPALFASCIEFAKINIPSFAIRANNYGITRTGTAIVDCKYNVPFQAIDDAICASKPELALCASE